MRKVVYISLLILTGYMTLIWYLSGLPNVSLVPESAIGFKVDAVVKHFIEFGIMGSLSLNFFYQLSKEASSASTFRLFLMASTVAIMWGVIDELHQFFVPTRICDLPDTIVDSAAAVVGVLFLIGFLKFNGHQFSAKSKVFLHTFGLSTLAGAVFLEGLVFFDIVTSGVFVACEHNIYILTSEVVLSGVSFMYFGYLWFRLLKGNL
jgi:hypothetical protein